MAASVPALGPMVNGSSKTLSGKISSLSGFNPSPIFQALSRIIILLAATSKPLAVGRRSQPVAASSAFEIVS